MKVDPQSVRQGAGKVDGARSEVAKIQVLDSSGATDGLSGFVTADVLSAASDASRMSLSVLDGRYDEIQQLLRRSADQYEHRDQRTAVSLTELVGNAMASMGDMNGAR